MQLGTTISTAGHVALLAWGLVTFSAKPFDSVQVEAMPVDIINAKEFSQITSGIKTAPKAETPKPLVEKVGDAKPVEDVTAKVSEKTEIKSAAAEAAPPPPPEAAPKPAEPKKAEKQPDQIADALKSEAKKEPPKPKPEPPKKPPQPKLDFSKIENKLALLDKREQRRNAATGETINMTPALGSASGRSQMLTMSFVNALVNKLEGCWKPDGGSLRDEVRSIFMTITFNPDGTLAAPPQIDVPPRSAREQALAEGVVRAVISCQPFTMLPRSQYEEWKRLEFKFCPIPPTEGGCVS
ncbi:MAG: protein TolA [Xanthobacteraceae bacterium]